MKIIKRNGAEEVFDIRKIVIAVTKADSSSEGRSLTDSQIEDIACRVCGRDTGYGGKPDHGDRRV